MRCTFSLLWLHRLLRPTRRYRISIPLPTRYRTRYKAQPNTAGAALGLARAESRFVRFHGRLPGNLPARYPCKKITLGGPTLYLRLYFTFFATGSFCARERIRAPNVDGYGKCIGNWNANPIVLHAGSVCVAISMSSEIARNICKNASIIFLNLIIFVLFDEVTYLSL